MAIFSIAGDRGVTLGGAVIVRFTRPSSGHQFRMTSALTHRRHNGPAKDDEGAAGEGKADDGEHAVGWLARFGLLARGVFYCILAYLVAQLAAFTGSGEQANAHGALTTVAATPGGLAAIGATAAGFLAFGIVRMWAAIRDKHPSTWHRVTTFAQGAFYVALTWVPLSYALGQHSAGSEKQHQQAADGLLRLPAGPVILFGLGLIVVFVCAHQIWTGVDRDYADGMNTDRSPPWVRKLVLASGTVGIPARAIVFFPTGVFFMIAAVQSDPHRADGLDKELTTLARHQWGTAILAIVSLGLAVFAVYSFSKRDTAL